MKFSVLALSSLALAFSAVLGSHGAATAAGSSVSFSATQATLGAKAYAQSCAVCHGASLKGKSAPALVGKTSGIAQQSIVEVYEYVSQQMPMTAPGSLSKAQYIGILAYILQQNGHKAGPRPLTEAVATTGTATIVANP